LECGNCLPLSVAPNQAGSQNASNRGAENDSLRIAINMPLSCLETDDGKQLPYSKTAARLPGKNGKSHPAGPDGFCWQAALPSTH
jgi:hypothetical protein